MSEREAGRAQAKDIDDYEILACIHRRVAHSRALLASAGQSVRDLLAAAFDRDASEPPYPHEYFAERGIPEKVVYAKMAKLDRRGLLEVGVSLRTAWLSDKGEALLAALEATRPEPKPHSPHESAVRGQP